MADDLGVIGAIRPENWNNLKEHVLRSTQHDHADSDTSDCDPSLLHGEQFPDVLLATHEGVLDHSKSHSQPQLDAMTGVAHQVAHQRQAQYTSGKNNIGN